MGCCSNMDCCRKTSDNVKNVTRSPEEKYMRSAYRKLQVYGFFFFAAGGLSIFLLIWTVWWMLMAQSRVPTDIRVRNYVASRIEILKILSPHGYNLERLNYGLLGGWPIENNILRLLAASLMVACVLLAALFAICCQSYVRTYTALLPVYLSVTEIVFIGSLALDLAVLIGAIDDCLADCPGSSCDCSLEAWHWVTIGCTIVTIIALLICVSILIWWIKHRKEVGEWVYGDDDSNFKRSADSPRSARAQSPRVQSPYDSMPNLGRKNDLDEIGSNSEVAV